MLALSCLLVLLFGLVRFFSLAQLLCACLAMSVLVGSMWLEPVEGGGGVGAGRVQ
jgi:hypothetical protein